MSARKLGENSLDEVLRALVEIDRKVLLGEVSPTDPAIRIQQSVLREQRFRLSQYEKPTIKPECTLCGAVVAVFGQLCANCRKTRESAK